jgi:hypothetical protein
MKIKHNHSATSRFNFMIFFAIEIINHLERDYCDHGGSSLMVAPGHFMNYKAPLPWHKCNLFLEAL